MIVFVHGVRKEQGYAIIAQHNGEYRRYCQFVSLGHASISLRELRNRMHNEGDDAVDWDNCDILKRDEKGRFKLA